jgi:hypothetical protein
MEIIDALLNIEKQLERLNTNLEKMICDKGLVTAT